MLINPIFFTYNLFFHKHDLIMIFTPWILLNLKRCYISGDVYLHLDARNIYKTLADTIWEGVIFCYLYILPIKIFIYNSLLDWKIILCPENAFEQFIFFLETIVTLFFYPIFIRQFWHIEKIGSEILWILIWELITLPENK